MKVYVDENDIDVLDDLFEATNSYECWACNRDDNLEIVSLADYTKQVRKEVVQKIKKLMQEKKGVMIGRYNYQTAQHDEVEIFELGDLNKVLNKIIGE